MRLPRPRRRLFILAAVAAGLLVGTVAVIHYVIPYRRHLEVRRQLAAFRADPSQENASRLTEIIASGRADKDEATEILRAWLDLKVSVEESYQPNMPIYVTLTSGNDTQLACGRWSEDEDKPQPTRDSPQVEIDLLNCSLSFSSHAVTPAHYGLNSDSVRLGPGLAGKLRSGVTSLTNPQLRPGPLSIAEPGVYPAFVTLAATPYITRSYDEMGEAGLVSHGTSGSLREADPGILDAILIRLGLKEDRGPERLRFKVKMPCEIRIVQAPEPPADKSP
jgi:hypothetical protein